MKKTFLTVFFLIFAVTVFVSPGLAEANRFTSIIIADDDAVEADGESEIVFDIRIYDESYNPVAGQEVYYASSRGAIDVFSPADPAGTEHVYVVVTDSLGQAEVSVTSRVIGNPAIGFALANSSGTVYEYLIDAGPTETDVRLIENFTFESYSGQRPDETDDKDFSNGIISVVKSGRDPIIDAEGLSGDMIVSENAMDEAADAGRKLIFEQPDVEIEIYPDALPPAEEYRFRFYGIDEEDEMDTDDDWRLYGEQYRFTLRNENGKDLEPERPLQVAFRVAGTGTVGGFFFPGNSNADVYIPGLTEGSWFSFDIPEAGVFCIAKDISGSHANITLYEGSRSVYRGIEKKILDTEPFIYSDRVMVPLRFVSESLGAEVVWQDATRTVWISGGGRNLFLREELPIDNGGFIIRDDRSFVPVRYVSENLGAEVNWDEDARRVWILK